jgi:hypothetical protein
MIVLNHHHDLLKKGIALVALEVLRWKIDPELMR